MANFKPTLVKSTSLDLLPMVAGQFILETDTGKMHFDVSNSTRISIGGGGGGKENNLICRAFTLFPSGWVASADEKFPYKYELVVENITNSSTVDAVFAPDSLEALVGNHMSSVTTTDTDKIIFKVTSIPTTNLSGTLKIIQKVADGDIPEGSSTTIIDDTTGETFKYGVDGGVFYIEKEDA